jgi:replication-associated recombination protein RarA
VTLSVDKMASISMTSTLPMVLSCVSTASPMFSSTSSVRVVSTVTMASPLRVLGVSRMIARAATKDTKNLEDAVQQAIEDAEEVCKADAAGACAEAWDEVEELAAAASHKKAANNGKQDPLEAFCEDNPETDECRVYED